MTVGGVNEANAWAWMSTELDRYLTKYGWALLNDDEWPVVFAAQAVCRMAADRISDAATAAGTQGPPPPLAVPAAVGPSGSTPSPFLSRSSATPLGQRARQATPTAPYSQQVNGSRPSKPSSPGDDSTGLPSATSPNYVSPNPHTQRRTTMHNESMKASTDASPVQRTIQELEMTTSDLKEIVIEFINRVRPVRREAMDVPSESLGQAVPEAPQSPIAQSISYQIDAIRSMQRRLREALDELEI